MATAWLRFFRCLRMAMKHSRSIINPAVGSTTETMMIYVVWLCFTGTELSADVGVGYTIVEPVGEAR